MQDRRATVSDRPREHDIRLVRERVGESIVSDRKHLSMCKGRGSVVGSDTATSNSRFARILQSTGWMVLRPRVERSQVVHLGLLESFGPAALCPNKGVVASLYLMASRKGSARVQDQPTPVMRTDPDAQHKILRKLSDGSKVLENLTVRQGLVPEFQAQP